MRKILYKKWSFLLLVALLVRVLGYSQNFPDTPPSLPAGKSVTISYQVQVDPNLPVSVTEVAEQDSVSYIDPANFLGRLWSLSDDPAIGAALDPTITSVIACDLIVTNCDALSDPDYDFSDVPTTAAERFADAGGLVNMVGDSPAPCGTVTITDDFVNPGECGGTALVTFTITDDRGTTTTTDDEAETCSVMITVNDDEAPTFSCPTPMTIRTTGGMGCEVNIPDFTVEVTDEMDNCDLGTNILQQTIPATSYSSSGHGTAIMVDLSLRDAANNEDMENCTVTLTVVDNVDPVANCQTFDAQLSVVTGEVTVLPGDIDDNSTDNCAIATYQIDGLASIDFTCADIGPNTVTLTVIDEAGRQNTCNATVNVLYSTSCPNPTIANMGGATIADPCSCSATPGYFDEEIVINGTNPGEAWRIESVSGFVDPNDFPNEFAAGDLFTDNNDGTYSLVGMHQSAVGYNLVAVSDFYPGVQLSISNLCYLPVLANADTSICSNEYLGIVLDNVPPSALADSFHVTSIDLGGSVQLNGIGENMGATNADLLADMVFEYTGSGSTTVEITVVPYNEDDCPGDPLVIMVTVENCSLACVDGVNITLPADCTLPLSIASVATDRDVVTRFGYTVLVDDGVFNGNIIDGAGTFTYGIFNRQNENVCWGTVTTTDRTKPVITPPADVDDLECWLIDDVLNIDGTVAPRGDGAGGNDDGVDNNHRNDLGAPTVIDGCEGVLPYTFSDVIQYFNCDPNGRYAVITRTFRAADSEGNTATANQMITFRTVNPGDFAFETDNDASDGQTFEMVDGKWVLTIQTCTPGEAEVPLQYPIRVDAFGNEVSLADANCNFSIVAQKTTFSKVCEDGYKEEHFYNLLDWCVGTSAPVFPYLVKVGDFEAPAPLANTCLQPLVDTLNTAVEIVDSLNTDALEASQVCGVVSTQPNNCTAALDISLAELESRYGALLEDCKAIDISVDVLSYLPVRIGSIPTGDTSWITGAYGRQGSMVMGLPEGKHALFITASDGCYNNAQFLLFFEVKDLIKPVMKCDDDLRVTLVEGDELIGVGGYAFVTYQGVNKGSWDNCELVNLEVRRSFFNDATGQARADWIAKNDPAGDDLLTDAAGNEDAGDDYTPWAEFAEFFCADVTEIGPDDGGVRVELRGTDRNGNQSTCWLDVEVENGTNFGVELVGGHKTIACTDLPANREDIDESFINDWGIYAAITGIGGCEVGEAGLNIDLSGLNQCGIGRIAVSIDPASVTEIETKNPVTISNDILYIIVAGDYDYWVKFPQDDEYFCADESAEGVTYGSEGCDLITIYENDERFESIADPNACYKILRTYKVINWCEYNGESQPVIVSRDWDAHNASSCQTNRNLALEQGNGDTHDAGEYNLNPLEPDGDGKPGDEDLYVIVDVNNVFPSATDTNADGAIQAIDGELDIVYYDNNNNPFDNSTADLFGDNDVSGPLSNYSWSGNQEYGTYRDQTSARNDEGYWWAVVRGETACGTSVSAWYDDDNDPANPDNRYGSFGYWQYTQHIIVYDDSDPLATLEIDDTSLCSLDGTNCDANVAFSLTVTDPCSTESIEVTYAINDLDQGMIAAGTGGDYSAVFSGAPIGTHTLRATIKDGCGNVVVLTEEFEVTDCKAPAPICHEDITVQLMPVEGDPEAAMAEIWASDLVASDLGDCSGQGPDLVNGLPRVTSFSINRLDATVSRAQTGLMFDCEDANDAFMVEVHTWDEVGNHDYCVTNVLVQDNNGICDFDVASGLIAGSISTETDVPVEGVEVSLSGRESRTFMTDANGEFGFEQLEEGYDYSIIPRKNVEHRNGISTFDLVLIQKHILGAARLNSPYKIIAADVNSSRSVTTLDLIQVRKLILNLETAFAGNTSWRFIDADFQFPDPQNPWASTFPEVKNINNLGRSDYANFVGVKIGDVNASAKAYNSQPVDPRRVVDVLDIRTENQELQAGNTYTISFRADLSQITGYQFTLELDPAYVELVDLQDGIAKAENFGVFVKEGMVTTSFHRAQDQNLTEDALFRLRLRSREDADLSEVIRLTSRYTHAEAYNLSEQDMNVQLLVGDRQTSEAFVLHQNMPNPFEAETKIGFELPAAMSGRLEFKDISGRTILLREGDFSKGYNELRLRADELPAAGVYFYTLHAGKFSATREMILMK